ncbi:3-methylcrotonyl-CoA carboxylase subunit alpha [Litorimonas cladophorae]|uniref:3-methylcrotonyl-CoA carboxylase subunit alpha n=1 Tax=Litorimonas cladophorae TaxID=1220491 RepID=A0A918NI04_9PROT|nr:acetyl/propionyl/methylcrotonyl-CoA carboxylase subunit alpha [Litorimonas cladophorae]GGX74477.1 3-methylcrotonyl-CoA carboxylase subunit alpha [Litorimonas cladophorae]
MTKSVINIKKILIANRGEIACRVIKTARKMGIATVAVYSDADRKALHVRLADEAVHIGPSPAVESYLVIDKIIAAAVETGADAVHPGYGFLSENPDFVRACEKAGLIFIGPSAEAMEAMGLKDAAKKLMDEAGVPITPGYHGKDQSPKLLKAKAGMIGYPVLIKAVAGGGGKGMRKVEADTDFDAALASCKREAASSFGNEDVLIEKYIQSPRHIEVQVFGDTHGNVVHMFERDCSLQRRHQKVIEEAPAPGMTDSVRKAMTDAAIKAAKAVNYVGAGTVEFIVDGSGKLRTDGFWFMEMNTRLQVEHPVTEMITGLDLVEWQIRVAQGEKLPAQETIEINGHAVEARLYAEDPIGGFLPSTGKIAHLWDFGSHGRHDRLRIDTGYKAPSEVTIHYDPMIAKIIGHGRDRSSAIQEVFSGLNKIFVHPLKTNSFTIFACLDHDEFWNENLSTHFFETYKDDLIPFDIREDDRAYGILALKLVSSLTTCNNDCRDASIEGFNLRDGWRMNRPDNSVFRFKRGDGICEVKIIGRYEGFDKVEVDGKPYVFQDIDYPPGGTIKEKLDYLHAWYFIRTKDYMILDFQRALFKFEIADGHLDLLAASSDAITAPMPGKIIALNVAIGDTVSEGDALVVMEAMKMEQTLTAPRDGVVAEVGAELGELVTDGAVLVSLEKEEKK